MSIELLLNDFKAVAEHPHRQADAYKAQGKKIIGVLPYYAPEELVYAAGMVPMGIWGSNNKNISRAKEYCASGCAILFLCAPAGEEREGGQQHGKKNH